MLEQDYKSLHQIPELGFKEFKTSAYLLSRLAHTKAKITKINTGILAFFDFQKEKTIAFRAEEDALPIKEKTSLPYASRNHRMHACGHDSHMAILLSLGDYIHQLDDYPYNLLLVFQPSEESFGGALSLIPSLSSLSFEAFFGMHVFPHFKKNTFYTSKIPLFSSATEIDLMILGKQDHIAHYKKQNDSIYLGYHYLKKIENLAKKEKIFFHAGKINGGTKRNVIAGKTMIKGTLRSDDISKNESFIKKMKALENDKLKIQCSPSIPSLINDKNVLKKLDSLPLNYLNKTLFEAEDFAFYPSYFHPCFFIMGLGNISSLHTNTFHVPLSSLKEGLNFYISILNLFK